MKIGITGDTHGSKPAMRLVLKLVPPVDYWFHTGDHGQDGLFLVQETGLPLLAVAGNTDAREGRGKIDEFITVAGKRIWLTHGHRYLSGYKVEELAWWARKLEVDIVVFGHTHIPLVKWCGDILLINPGSPALPRSEEGATFAVLNLQVGVKPEVELINIT
ncbi:MAG: metallophosphoesterase [Acidaminococcaceae bacterium]